ncbi:MAG: aminopeptidase, partial [Deltaproteobacteria bacterium]|nr:aminopeptidase [Deltaproteobacteria bacterium]
KDALKPHRWQFPIVGKVPYLGFFEEAQGRQQKRILEEKNLDTYLRPVSAYSSLGFFADPIYSPMLGEKPDRLVEIVIHESTHTTIFLRNEVDFNESLAVFVGQQGTLNFLARLAGPHAPIVLKAHARFSRRQRFGALVAALRDRLNAIYRSPLPFSTKVARRESIFAWAKDRYRHLFPGRPNALFLRRPLNNAVVLSLGRYLAGVNFHRQVYRCVNRDLAALVSLYKRAQAYRHPIAWAARRCHLHLPAPQHE